MSQTNYNQKLHAKATNLPIAEVPTKVMNLEFQNARSAALSKMTVGQVAVIKAIEEGLYSVPNLGPAGMAELLVKLGASAKYASEK